MTLMNEVRLSWVEEQGFRNDDSVVSVGELRGASDECVRLRYQFKRSLLD